MASSTIRASLLPADSKSPPQASRADVSCTCNANNLFRDSFGPPSQGGFQHGQQGNNYGGYYQSNPQGSNDAYAANQAWMNSNEGTLHQQGQGQGQQQYPQTARQSSDPNAPNYDPNAPPMTEQDRGLLGALGGGAAGAWGGHKAGHGFLGAIGGAIMGSLAEDFAKKKKHSGGSTWGGR
jgi:hypothetical protein